VRVDLHQLELRFEALRSKSANKERRLMASLLDSGQQHRLVVVEAERSCLHQTADSEEAVQKPRLEVHPKSPRRR
jgi:hypothetical protein